QIDLRHELPRARTQRHIGEHPDVFAQRVLALGSTVEIVEHHPRQTAACELPQIGDVDGPRSKSTHDNASSVVSRPRACEGAPRMITAKPYEGLPPLERCVPVALTGR